MKKEVTFFILIIICISDAYSAFLNPGPIPNPQQAIIYDPCRFDFDSDAVSNYVQQTIQTRWGTDVQGYFVRRPNPSLPQFPGDDPETTITDFFNRISSGDYGFYMISAHGSPFNLLIEPYCRQELTQETAAISKYLADMAWYRYTGEDFYDPNVLNADYDNDGMPLCGPNGEVEYWLDEFGSPIFPPGGLPYDDDLGDFYYAINDDDEDGQYDEDPVNGLDDDGDGLIVSVR